MTSLTQNKEEKDWHPDGKRAKEINGHFRIKRMYKQPKNIGKSAPPFQSSEEDKLKPQIPLDTCQKCKNERQKIIFFRREESYGKDYHHCLPYHELFSTT